MNDKLIASAIHLAISLLVAIVVLALLFWFWFPSPLMGLGAIQGVQLILIIDLIIGPLCTFIVFKKGKPGMVFDLCVIGMLQISAVCYGLWMVSGQKPSYILFTYEGLELVSEYDQKQMLSEEDQIMLANILDSTLTYEGIIPVITIYESESASKRSAESMVFLLNEGLPYVFNVAEYMTISSIQEVPSVSSKTFDTGDGCLIVPVRSVHGEAKACITEQGGKIVSF